MTILVHGSITPIIRKPTLNLLIRLVQDRLDGTLYQRATNLIRKDPYFTKDHPMQGLGLEKVIVDKRVPLSSTLFFSQALDLVSDWANSSGKEQKRFYYTYGWSGIVGKKIRYKDSVRFYKELSKEVTRLRKAGVDPKIRVIGFSHGGSVALDLALVCKRENLPQTFTVDEMILVGMPISTSMNPQLHSPLFRKIYNLYSRCDSVQRLDFLASGGLFSKRFFVPKKGRPLSRKLKQIEIKIMINKKSKHQNENCLDGYGDNVKILSGKSKILKNVSPYHLENWFFGWTDRGYRRDFPFYPLPVSTIIPVIVKAVDKHGCEHCSVDIRPEQNKIIVNNRDKKYFVENLFPEKKNLFEMISIVPKSFIVKRSPKEYWDHVNFCIKKAKLNTSHTF